MDSIGQKLLDVAKSQLGYHEKASGYTKFGDWYGKHIDKGSYYKDAPWCDMFLAWAADKAGVEDWTGQFASTPDHAKWFKKHDAWGHKAEPGAIVFFSWSGGKGVGDIEHVGIVERVDGHTLHTIEANHNNALLRATRDISQVVGFGYPSKVKVKAAPAQTAQTAQTEQKYAPKHSAPPPAAKEIGQDVQTQVDSHTTAAPDPAAPSSPLPDQQAALTGLLAVVLFGTVALAIGKSKVKVPVSAPNVRVRKRGKHHRTPVELPAEVSVADLDAADAGTMVMPVLSAEVAAKAEDQEFWGKIAELEEDVELAFWNTLHSAVSQNPSESVFS
ncbi:CHAP domain-containing protein [Actinoallomurus purpureus]|uniref:CHAP domain-containing protein n=1 Tax=Actinoallomurus purpureus TaxID=478114 RepID=UPI002092EE5E|nr:CHAP domain-containing protein [Actinoallomurus purpureus]MCO6005006.1 CHAP domain-containing protein [Actinoallomurus purpureus]